MTLPVENQLKQIDAQKANWTLAQDNALCSALDGLTSVLVNRLDESDRLIEKTAVEVGRCSVRIAQLNTRLSVFKSNRFIENCVHDDSPDAAQLADATAERSAKTLDNNQQDSIKAIREAVAIGYQVIDNAYRRIDCASEDFEADQTFVPDPIYEPLDPYLNRPLPYLIGSEQFMHHEHVGLVDAAKPSSRSGHEKVVINLPTTTNMLEDEEPSKRTETSITATATSTGQRDLSQSVFDREDLCRKSESLSVSSKGSVPLTPAVIPPPSNIIPRVISTFSDSDSDSSDSLFGSSSSRTKTTLQDKPLSENSLVPMVDPNGRSSGNVVIPGRSVEKSSSSSTKGRPESPSSSHSDSPSPPLRTFLPGLVSREAVSGSALTPSKTAIVEEPREQRATAFPPASVKTLPKKASALPAKSSNSLFDDSDSEDDLFSSVPRKPTIPKLQRLPGEFVTAPNRPNTQTVEPTLNNPFHAPTPSEPQPRIKPSQSVFDDSYDSAEDLFGNSSQKIRLPFGRKKGSTPESVKKEETNKKSSTETKKQVAQGQVDIGVTKNPRSASIEEKLFDPLQDQAPHEDESAREVEVAPKAVVEQVANERNTSVPSSLNDIGEEVSDLERLTEAAGDFSKETEVMSTSSRVSVASNMKLKSKANDLFVAKLSATLGQGPPKIRQPAQPKNDAKNAEENENAASSATVPKPIPPPTTNDSLTSILKSRPKGPARRRPQQGISHPDAASTEAASASDDVKRVGIKTPQEVDSLPARNSMNEATSTDEKIETIVKVSETSSPAVTKKVSVTARTSSSASTKRSLFDDSDDDLFASHVTSSTKNNETEKTNTEKPSATVQARDVPVKPANRQIPKAAAVRKPGLFDESDSDSDLFK